MMLSIFYMFIGHLYILLHEVSIHVFCPFLNCLLCIVLVLYVFLVQVFVCHTFTNIFSQYVACRIYLLNDIFWWVESFKFDPGLSIFKGFPQIPACPCFETCFPHDAAQGMNEGTREEKGFIRISTFLVKIFWKSCLVDTVICFGGGNGSPLQYSCLGNPTDRGAWRATVHGVARSQTWPSD